MAEKSAVEEFLEEALKDYEDGLEGVEVSGNVIFVYGAEPFRKIADKAGIKEFEMDDSELYFSLDNPRWPEKYNVHLKSEGREFLNFINAPENKGRYIIRTH